MANLPPVIPPTREFLLEVVAGQHPSYQLVNKFGHNGSVGTTLVPITGSGLYQTPTTAQALELVSTDAADNATGLGARSVKIDGLDADCNQHWLHGCKPSAPVGSVSVEFQILLVKNT